MALNFSRMRCGETLFTDTIKDITERKPSKEEVQNQLKPFQTLIDTMPSPIFYKDAKSILCHDN